MPSLWKVRPAWANGALLFVPVKHMTAFKKFLHDTVPVDTGSVILFRMSSGFLLEAGFSHLYSMTRGMGEPLLQHNSATCGQFLHNTENYWEARGIRAGRSVTEATAFRMGLTR